LTFSVISATLRQDIVPLPERSHAMAAEEREGPDKRFCPYCFMQQFEVSETATDGSVYCEVCGIDILIKELVKL